MALVLGGTSVSDEVDASIYLGTSEIFDALESMRIDEEIARLEFEKLEPNGDFDNELELYHNIIQGIELNGADKCRKDILRIMENYQPEPQAQ